MSRGIETEAWVLRASDPGRKREPAVLTLESFHFPDIREDEILVEPLVGCWEGNMSHAVERNPVDICRQRREERIVLGNAGVVRVLRIGSEADGLKEGDLAMVFCSASLDRFGYPETIYAYDAPNTVGLLAKRTKLKRRQLIRLPEGSRFSIAQWAAFSLRYITAWANWRIAHACWTSQFTPVELPVARVWGWGGGVSFAELTLAALLGARSGMITSSPERMLKIADAGMIPLDRSRFPHLTHDDQQYRTDPKYQKAYMESEDAFCAEISRLTDGEGVSIFVDHVGSPVIRATLRALTRGGVVTTAGWKLGMRITTMRALECMQRHTHVHTHYARRSEAVKAIRFAEERSWMPDVGARVYSWEEIPRLASDHASGRIAEYFPLFHVNGPGETNPE